MEQPLNSFNFQCPSKLICKPSFDGFDSEVKKLGKNFLLVCGQSLERQNKLLKYVKPILTLQVKHEPSVEQVEEFRAQCSEKPIDCIIGLGGGSVLDTAKALACLIPQTAPALNYLEIIGNSAPLTYPPLPTVLVPTTAGTGAEATKNAVLTHTPSSRKVSLRSEQLFAKLVWLNPSLLTSLPSTLTSNCGFDTLTQLIEAYTSRKATPLTDLFCEKGLQYCSDSLRKSYYEPKNFEARQNMLLASFYSGVALANGGLGAVHGLAAPLGGMTGASHGSICAALLYSATKENINQLDPSHPSYKKYEWISKVLNPTKKASTSELLNWILELSRDLKIKSLKRLGYRMQNTSQLVKMALTSNSMKGNPVTLSEASLSKILFDAS